MALLSILICGLLPTSPEQQNPHWASGNQYHSHAGNQRAPNGSGVSVDNVSPKDAESPEFHNHPDKDAHHSEQRWWQFRTDPNWVIATFTIVLAVIGGIQARIYWQQRRIMQNSLRPRLILREAYTLPDVGKPVLVTFNFENAGSSEATIVDSRFTILHSPYGGSKRQVVFGGRLEPGEINHPISPNQKIQAGAFHSSVCSHELMFWMPGWVESAIGPHGGYKTILPTDNLGPWAVYFYGRISYKDSLKVVRQMAFYRVLDFGSYRFVPFPDPQLEWADERP